jgi:hypothetical protein
VPVPGDGDLGVTGVCDPQGMRIDCDECVMQGTEVCDDCVVTFLIRRPTRDAVILDLDEERALRRLAGAGLVPELRHVARPGA